MKSYLAELHIHTVVSPCAGIEMIPPLIVQEALERGINFIAITDHNTTANVRAVQMAARGTDLTVLPGMELQTKEEVHLLCLFDTLDQAEAWQALVRARMPPLENNIEFFDLLKQEGLLRNLIIRTASNNEVMVIVSFFSHI